MHDFDTQDGVDFLVMEHLEDETLADRSRADLWHSSRPCARAPRRQASRLLSVQTLAASDTPDGLAASAGVAVQGR